MANRTFIDVSYSLAKRLVHLFADVTVTEGVTTVVLNKWNYPTLGVGGRTYSAAPTGAAVPTSAGNYPNQYQVGAEGLLTVVRTAAGLWTVRLQDNYQRLMDVNAYASAAGGTPVFAKVTENTTITNMTSAGGSLIGLAFWDFAAVLVDPIGHVRLHLILADATEP